MKQYEKAVDSHTKELKELKQQLKRLGMMVERLVHDNKRLERKIIAQNDKIVTMSQHIRGKQ